ncbi:hypothetical protein [Actomonas aquatica]|uniref:Hydantoinase A/oxoprolinase domain-containing protein n=1 Tax=Actomonas aquatica TaxID=2866162 RepID=A0ABZ1C4P1_9BACT|nr:hypothetical protein [Opitutus sp. WL0086]WRQ86696.1 hypothetical protein K1X11_017930 [Opitutus sp. WL0086]
MAFACGIEFSDFGFNAATVSVDGTAETAVNELDGLWPAFAAWDGSKLVFGRAAEAQSRLHPRATSHVFWEHLSLAPSDLQGPPRVPAYSELAYAFLSEFWREVVERVGQPERVALAMPGQLMGESGGDNPGMGMILAMARDLGMPLTSISGLSISSLNDVESTAGLSSGRLLYLDLHLHSAAMSLLSTDGEGKMLRRRHLRLPRLGYIPLMQGLLRTMGNRFLKATAFDVTAQRELEQAFYDQTREQLLAASGGADVRYSISTATRVHQAAFPREALLRDLAPLEQGWAEAAVKFLRDASLTPKDVTVVISSRGRLLPGLDDAFGQRGFKHITQLKVGAAARGAARFAAELSPCADVTEVPVINEVALARGGAAGGDGLEILHLASPYPMPALAPSHLVVDGSAYSLFALPNTLHRGPDGELAVQALGRLGEVDVRLNREAGEWHLEAPTTGVPPIRVGTGDRIKLRANDQEVEMIIAAERRPGAL